MEQFPLEKLAFYPLKSCMVLLESEQNMLRANSENIIFNVCLQSGLWGVAL